MALKWTFRKCISLLFPFVDGDFSLPCWLTRVYIGVGGGQTDGALKHMNHEYLSFKSVPVQNVGPFVCTCLYCCVGAKVRFLFCVFLLIYTNVY